MPTFDGVNLIVTLDPPTAGVLTLDVREVLYEGWKDWLLENGSNRGFPSLFRPVGGDVVVNIKSGAYFFWRNDLGWRMRSSEDDQTITVIGNIVPEDSNLPITIPTVGGFTVMYNGFQPITQNIDAIVAKQLEALTFNNWIALR